MRRTLGWHWATLEELLADRIAGEAPRITDDPIRAMFAVTKFDPDEVYVS